nr:MAG TPA: hypothetical protein [Caudoviricetes sp.]
MILFMFVLTIFHENIHPYTQMWFLSYFPLCFIRLLP